LNQTRLIANMFLFAVMATNGETLSGCGTAHGLETDRLGGR